MVTKCTSKRISIHIQRSPGCTVTSIVPAFTYASRLPVTRQPAGVLAAVGYTRYLALVPPPVVSITNEIRYFTSYRAFSSGSQRCHVTTRALCCDSRRTVFHNAVDQLQNVVLAVDIAEWVVLHGLFEVNRIEYFYLIPAALKHFPTFQNDRAFRVLSIRIEKKANYFYEVTASD